MVSRLGFYVQSEAMGQVGICCFLSGNSFQSRFISGKTSSSFSKYANAGLHQAGRVASCS